MTLADGSGGIHLQRVRTESSSCEGPREPQDAVTLKQRWEWFPSGNSWVLPYLSWSAGVQRERKGKEDTLLPSFLPFRFEFLSSYNESSHPNKNVLNLDMHSQSYPPWERGKLGVSLTGCLPWPPQPVGRLGTARWCSGAPAVCDPKPSGKEKAGSYDQGPWRPSPNHYPKQTAFTCALENLSASAGSWLLAFSYSLSWPGHTVTTSRCPF